MKKPEPKDYGFQEKESFDHEHGWMIEGGEEVYYKADSEYQEWLVNQNNLLDITLKPKEVGITSHPNHPSLGIVIKVGKIPIPDL